MLRSRSTIHAPLCLLLAILLTDVPALGQNALLPDLFMEPSRLTNNTIDTNALPGRVLFRFDSSIPNIGAGEFQLEANGMDAGNGRQFVDQRIFRDDMTSFTVDAGDFVYNPPTTSMESTTWVSYRIRSILPNDGVGPILAEGGKPAVHITSSTSYDLSLPNAPGPSERIIASGGVHGISVGWTDIYSRFLPMQWIDITGLQSGEYWLEVVVDPGNNVMEEDDTNNTSRIKVMLDLPDDDADGLADTFEDMIGTDPNDSDSDNDGLTDGEEVGYDGDITMYDPFHPTDNPTGTDTDALYGDTDMDGTRDGTEVNLGFDPLDPSDGGQVVVGELPYMILLYLFLLVFAFLALRRA